MQINFTGRHIEVTPALKTLTTEKLQRVERHHHAIQSINVVFHVENLSQTAEASLFVDGTEIHATATTEDMYASVDAMVEKLLAQLTKLKEKHTDHR